MITFGPMAIYADARLEDGARCLLVIVGATAEGEKEAVEKSWHCLRGYNQCRKSSWVKGSDGLEIVRSQAA
jgi:hypothetical protein